jgi:hypothetical protein
MISANCIGFDLLIIYDAGPEREIVFRHGLTYAGPIMLARASGVIMQVDPASGQITRYCSGAVPDASVSIKDDMEHLSDYDSFLHIITVYNSNYA